MTAWRRPSLLVATRSLSGIRASWCGRLLHLSHPPRRQAYSTGAPLPAHHADQPHGRRAVQGRRRHTAPCLSRTGTVARLLPHRAALVAPCGSYQASTRPTLTTRNRAPSLPTAWRRPSLVVATRSL